MMLIGVASSSLTVTEMEKLIAKLETEKTELESKVASLENKQGQRKLQICEDSTEWYKTGEPSKGCSWVATYSSARCGLLGGSDGVRGWDGSSAADACAYTCGTCSTAGQDFMELVDIEDYDSTSDSIHWRQNSIWTSDVQGSRAFRETETGSQVYNYRNKVLMGLAQTSILNDPPSVTEKDAVEFTLPEVIRPADDVLEMQALLRQGDLTSVELTTIAWSMLEKYDAEFNILEVSLYDLAMDLAAAADEKFAAGSYDSYIQGIPFAVKDTYDVRGYATAYGSFEFLDNIINDAESPLVTYAVDAGAIPLFKSTVPQLTWGTANYNGTVYSCLNGGYSAGTGNSGGSSIGSGNAVCLGVVPIAICEQTGSSCQAPAIANGITTIIPALGTFSREANGLYSMDSDRPGLFCRDVMSCAVFFNYQRGTSAGDPQSRDVPFYDPSAEDLSTYTIGFVDNSDTSAWPLAWDTPLKGLRGDVLEALQATGAAEVTEETDLANFVTPTQLYEDYLSSGMTSGGSFQSFDWYYLNVEGFFESIFKYGGTDSVSYGPVWQGQNFNNHRNHVGATAYAYLDDLWIHGYVAENAMYQMLEDLPDVIVHFGQSELQGRLRTSLVKRAGINTVHFPQFFWNTTSEDFADWDGSKPADYYSETTVSAAMITCESKKYEMYKAMAVCNYLQETLVEGGKLISPHIDTIHTALKENKHDLDCPYDWSIKKPDFLDGYPAHVAEKVSAALENNIGNVAFCESAYERP